MTIESNMPLQGSFIRRMTRWAGLAMIVLSIWACIMIAMPFVGPSGRQVAVVGNVGNAITAVHAAGGRVINVRKGATIAKSDDPDFPKKLYQAGAVLVLEARLAGGCFPRSSTSGA